MHDAAMTGITFVPIVHLVYLGCSLTVLKQAFRQGTPYPKLHDNPLRRMAESTHSDGLKLATCCARTQPSQGTTEGNHSQGQEKLFRRRRSGSPPQKGEKKEDRAKVSAGCHPSSRTLEMSAKGINPDAWREWSLPHPRSMWMKNTGGEGRGGEGESGSWMQGKRICRT